MCRCAAEGGRRCPGHSAEARRARRGEARENTAQERLRAFVGATPYRPESEALLRMSSRPSYHATDEWIEYSDSVRDIADRHAVEIVRADEAHGIWQGTAEPSGAYLVRSDSPEQLHEFAAELAGRYNQDSIMLGRFDPDGPAYVYTYAANVNAPRKVMGALAEAGVEGGTLNNGQLQLVSDGAELSPLVRRVLDAQFGHPQVARAHVEFVEGTDEHRARTPIKEIQSIREHYNDDHGIPPRRPMPKMTEADDLASAVAYDRGTHQPRDPRIQRSYRVFRQHIVQQWEALSAAGYTFHPWHGDTDQPYAHSAAMIDDLRNNKHLYYYPTDTGGDLSDDHPMMRTVTVTTAPGVRTRMLANDVFRAVHDCIAHSEGHQFGPYGERRAWWTHRSSLPSEARLALWNETRGQNTWTNAGPHMQTRDPEGQIRRIRPGEPGYLRQTERPYGDQKCVIPDNAAALI